MTDMRKALQGSAAQGAKHLQRPILMLNLCCHLLNLQPLQTATAAAAAAEIHPHKDTDVEIIGSMFHRLRFGLPQDGAAALHDI